MSDEGAWFRRRRHGFGYSAATCQGVVATPAFVIVLLATVFSGDPNTARPASVPTFLRIKALFGLGGTHLPVGVMLTLILAEVGGFLLVVWWSSRTVKPLD